MVCSPELQLIIDLCALLSKNVFDSDLQEKCSHTYDWEHFLRCAASENVSGIIFYVLKKRGLLESIPQEVSEKLEHEFLGIKSKNLLLMDELKSVSRIFEEEKIPALIIKGAALLSLCYPDKGMRVMDDIDIVVGQEQFAYVQNLLREKGYRQNSIYRHLFYAPSGIVFDLHADAFDQERIRTRKYYCQWDMQTMLARAVSIDDMIYVKNISPPDQVVISCIHNEKHSYNSLQQFIDVVMLLERYKDGINCGTLHESIDMLGGRRPSRFTLEFLRDVLQYKSPLLGCSGINTVKLSGYEKKILSMVKERRRIPMLGIIMPIFSIDGCLKKLYYVGENVFPRPKVMKEIYGLSSGVYLIYFYPYRFFSLCVQGVKALCKCL
ncbi:MAG: nucleotidyltransferase family protein [Candidatus Ancaeobacter aquaticus]|nr:nucleotidyltransferase family protein [Candidatus Ancaeobacter aquaticus]